MTRPEASVQLYSLAGELAADQNGSLDKLAAIGLKNVEPFNFIGNAAPFRAALDASGLKAPTAHAPILSDQIMTAEGLVPAPAQEKIFEDAATVGITTVIDPFLAPELWATIEGTDDIADRLNRAAEVAAGFGLSVGYHNHAQEFNASFDGVTAYERVASLLDERVKYELDLYWALIGGQDVPALVERLGSRLLAVHVKDGPKVANPWAPDAPQLDPGALVQVHAGLGEVPLAASINAASDLSFAVIEYDKAPGDVFEDIAASYAFLTSEGLVK